MSKTLASPKKSREERLLANSSISESALDQVCVTGTQLDVQDLSYNVQSRGKTKVILRNLSFRLEAGSLCALMGPSGSGKSTLLDLLADRKLDGAWSGDITFNGGLRSRWFSRDSAYILQSDVHIPTLKVREVLYYATWVRLPEGTTKKGIEDRVDMLLELMGLTHVQHSIVGDSMTKGISGGQLKRLSIAVEIAALPDLIFLDEPTSGLDSSIALEVMSLVRRLSDQNRTCISTIHQPSPEIFALFDKVVLLCAGRLVYAGPAKQAVDYFTRPTMGYEYPDGYNPAEFILDITEGQVLPAESAYDRNVPRSPVELEQLYMVSEVHANQFSTEITNGGSKSEHAAESTYNPIILPDAEKGSVAAAGTTAGASAGGGVRQNSPKHQLRVSDVLLLRPYGRMHAVGKLSQFHMLLSRTWLAQMRDVAQISTQLVKNIMVGLLVGVIFYGECNAEEPLYTDGVPNAEVSNISSQLFFGLMFVMVSNAEAIPYLCSRNILYRRESAAFAYSAAPYWLSQCLTVVPLLMINQMVFQCILYFLVDFPMNEGYFFYYYVIVLLANLCSFYLAMSLAAGLGDEQLAFVFFPLTFLILSNFCGYSIVLDDVPSYYKWITEIDYVRWAFEGLMVNQWDRFDSDDYTYAINGNGNVLESYDFDGYDKNDSYWILVLNVGALMLVLYVTMRPPVKRLRKVPDATVPSSGRNLTDMVASATTAAGSAVGVDGMGNATGDDEFAEGGGAAEKTVAGETSAAAMAAEMAAQDLEDDPAEDGEIHEERIVATKPAAATATAAAAGGSARSNCGNSNGSDDGKKKSKSRVVFNAMHPGHGQQHTHDDPEAGSTKPGEVASADDDLCGFRTISDVDHFRRLSQSSGLEGTGGSGGDGDSALGLEAGSARSGTAVSSNTAAARRGTRLLFHDVHYSVRSSGDRSKTLHLLKGVSGRVAPEEMIALMGASGAGKSTLLDVLAGRKTTGEIGGEVYFNGVPRSREVMRRTAYVMQDDVHVTELTVRQNLYFAAQLRLRETMSSIIKRRRVEQILQMLDLAEVADSIVGGEVRRGISGGQLKRLSIAVEIVHLPSLIFLDEPTTGLDSAIAFEVMSAIKALTYQRRTIICTIHQPSQRAFALFDKLLLLAEGRTIFFGATADAVKFFTADPFCFRHKQGSNVADFVIAVGGGFLPCGDGRTVTGAELAEHYANTDQCKAFLAGITDQVAADLADSSAQRAVEALVRVGEEDTTDPIRLNATLAARALTVKEQDKKNSWLANPVTAVGDLFGGAGAATSRSHRERRYNTSLFHQIKVLTQRQALIAIVNYPVTLGMFGRNAFIGFFYGSLYFHLDTDTTDPNAYNNRLVLLFFSILSMIVGKQEKIPTMQYFRLLFYRERGANSVSEIADWVSQILISIPLSFICVLLYSAFVYPMVQFRSGFDHFIFFFIVLWIVDWIALFSCQAISGIAPSTQAAMNLFPVAVLFVTAFAGYIVYLPQFPPALSWAPYCDFFRYAFQALVLNEFDGNSDDLPDEKQYIDNLGFEYISKNDCLLLLIMFMGAYALIALTVTLTVNFEKR